VHRADLFLRVKGRDYIYENSMSTQSLALSAHLSPDQTGRAARSKSSRAPATQSNSEHCRTELGITGDRDQGTEENESQVLCREEMSGETGRSSRDAHLEAVNGEEATEDALLEPRAQHDHVVLLVHGWRPASRGGGLLLRRRRSGVDEWQRASGCV
jgi:hypothetical protein